MRSEVRERILNKYNNKCCFCESTKRLEIDHIIPISKGGREDEENMQILCKTCNISKGNRINIADWMIYDKREDCILINKKIPLFAFKPHEVKACISLLFKYSNE
jgi:hypothetical protein